MTEKNIIQSKKELKFYLRADEIMNEQVFPQSGGGRFCFRHLSESF